MARLKVHGRLAVMCAVAVIGVGAFFVQDRINHGPLPFNRKLWDAEPKAWDDETRERLADGLLASKVLIGKLRADIVALLGEPPPTDYFREFDLVYWLGAERGLMRLDSEWLVMRLDATGRVSEAMIVTD